MTTLTATVTDRAGHQTTRTATFTVGGTTGRSRMMGVIDRQQYGRLGIKATVIAFNWFRYEQTQGQYDDAYLDGLIAAAVAAGQTQIRLRPMAGVNAPPYVKAYGIVNLIDPQDNSVILGDDGSPGTCLWWKPEVLARYVALDEHLAARYDNDPRITEITVFYGGSQFDEPTIRQYMVPANCTAYVAKGYDYVKDIQAIKDWNTATSARWRKKGLNFWPSSPFQVILPTGVKGNGDWSITLDLARTAVALGIAIGQNSVGPTSDTDPECLDLSAIADAIISAQTETFKKMGSTRLAIIKTVEAMARLGAIAVELPASYNTVLTAQDVVYLNGLLAANA